MKTISSLFFITLFAALGLGLGGWSALQALEQQIFVERIQRGVWVAYPDLGSANADPYLQARAAQRGLLPLGPAEGLVFSTSVDSDNQPLLRQCNYTLFGEVPIARLWTLTATDVDDRPIDLSSAAQNTFHSYSIVYEDDFLELNIGPTAAPLNWYTMNGTGGVSLILRLYDTPITSTTGVSAFSMPRIKRRNCL